MKAVIFTLVSLLLINDAFALKAQTQKSFTKQEISQLISAMKKRAAKRKLRAKAASVAKIFLSPEAPKAGDTVVAYLAPSTTYEGSETIFETTLDGQAMTLEQPASNMWVLNAGKMTEVRAHTLVVSAFIQDKVEAERTRDAISALELSIADLNSQLASASDPEVIAQLTAERDEKVAQKNALVQQLANLRAPLGQQTLNFSIAENTSGDYPHITSSSPSVGNVIGGTTITVTGSNFHVGSEVTLGGISVTPVSLTSSQIVFLAPQFPDEAFRDLEVRYTDNGEVKNAILKNAYFSTLQGYDPTARPTPPVAVAKAIQAQIDLGSSANFTSFGSYDVNGQSFHFEWKVISKPNGSLVTIPTNPPGSGNAFSFMPDAPGSYVVELKAFEESLPFYVSEPSLAVVEVLAPANSAPTGSAPSITVGQSGTKTSQISASDADFWQSRNFFVTKQGSLGTASVSAAGLVTYQAGATTGSDSIDVMVVDNGTPPLSTVVTVPVSVVNNQPPVFSAGILARQKTEGLPYQARLSQNISTNGTVDPDGTISEIWWDFGDGTREKTLDRNSNYLFHNYMAPGAYTVTVTATDNLGASTSQSTTLNIVDTDIPTAKFKASPLFGTFPLTVSFDASDSSDADGIVQYQWLFAGSPSSNISTPLITHTYNAPGTYNVRLRTIDAYGMEGETNVPVTVGTSSGGMPPQALPQALPRMFMVGTATNFLSGRSFAASVGSTLSNFNWILGDFIACPSDGCSANSQDVNWTYQAPNTFYVGHQVTDSLGSISNRTYVETIAVNSGTPPRAVARANTFVGVAPFTLNVNALESYVYNGGAPITHYTYFWGDNTGDVNVTSPTASHTYSTPNSYSFTLQVIDANGNIGSFPQTVVVTSTKAQAEALVKKLDEAPADPEHEYQRQLLSGACGQGDASACYGLGKMYNEDGNEFAKQKLWEKACGMGYAPACQK